MNIRLTSELRAELQRLADEDGRKLSAYIERLLQLHVRAAKEALDAGEGAKPERGHHLLHQHFLMEEPGHFSLRKKKRD